MLSPVSPSVTWLDQSKTVKVRIMKFSPYGNPIPLCVHPCRVFLYALYNSWGGAKNAQLSRLLRIRSANGYYKSENVTLSAVIQPYFCEIWRGSNGQIRQIDKRD